MPQIQFYPIDIKYKVMNNRPVIHIFGKTIDNKRILVIDKTFLPYFYVLPKEHANIIELKKSIEGTKLEGEEEYSIISTEIMQKKYCGTAVLAIKVIVNLPAAVKELREKLKILAGVREILEADILFTRRYMIDKGIVPLTLSQVDGEEVFVKVRCDVIIDAKEVKNVSSDILEKPKLLSFDIETYNPFGKRMVPEENPIVMLAFYGENFQKVITWKTFKTDEKYIEFVESEVELIERFKEVIENYKPDILAGYFSDGFDLPYIKVRADKYKIKLNIGVDYSDIDFGRRKEDAKIDGIIHLDVFKFVRKVLGRSMDTDSYSLDPVAEELLDEKKEVVDLDLLAHTWDNNVSELGVYCRYNLKDAELTFKLAEHIFPTVVELVKIVGLPVFDVNRSGFSQLVEWLLIKRAAGFEELVPNKPDYQETKKRMEKSYMGAFVFEPKPGLYNEIVIFDFRSLYPTIIASHNISPGTFRCGCCRDNMVPIENDNYWFCKKKKGFIPQIIEEIILRRQRVKEIISKETPSQFLEARQNTLKLLANSFYGYLGFYAARWYSWESAKSVTAYGRFYIKQVIEKAQARGFLVLYSDTDSVFLTLENKTEKDAISFVEQINMELPELMELEYEGHYPAGIFVFAKEGMYGAKKKYALLTANGDIKIKGFETIRRNWSLIAKEVQEKVLEIILREKDSKKALKYVRTVIQEIRENKVPKEKVIIFTQLQKEIDNYDAVGPHVAVARRMKQKDMPIGPGSIIKYIITRGNEKIRDRARLPEEIGQNDYDPNYYIDNQIIPSVERIFNVLGFTSEDLLDKKDQSKLDSFFK